MVNVSSFNFLVLYAMILLAVNDSVLLSEIKNMLSNNFAMKDLGKSSYVLGIHIHRTRENGVLTTISYIDDGY